MYGESMRGQAAGAGGAAASGIVSYNVVDGMTSGLEQRGIDTLGVIANPMGSDWFQVASAFGGMAGETAAMTPQMAMSAFHTAAAMLATVLHAMGPKVDPLANFIARHLT